MVGGGEGGARAAKVDHSTFLRIFFEDVTSDVDPSLTDSISTHFSRKIFEPIFSQTCEKLESDRILSL